MFSSDPQFDLSLLTDTLRRDGLCIIDQALDPALTQGLYQRLDSMRAEQFHLAGVGRDDEFRVKTDIRSDRIHWIDGTSPAEQAYLQVMEKIRTSVNRALFMGLFDYESHFAYYPPGAFYTRHLDAFRGRSSRLLTTVFYLNPDWQSGLGGELVVYRPDSELELLRVAPEMGRLVCFISDEFPHEVLPAERMRYSIAGWFRVNSNLGDHIDPPK